MGQALSQPGPNLWDRTDGFTGAGAVRRTDELQTPANAAVNSKSFTTHNLTSPCAFQLERSGVFKGPRGRVVIHADKHTDM